MIVLDASAAVAVLLNSDESALHIRARIEQADDELHVPHFFEIEVMSVLRRYVLSQRLSEGRSGELFEDFMTMRLTRYPHTALLSRVWELRNNVTAYDAAYVALAETLGAPLVTMDERLSRAFGIHAAVEVYGQ